MKKQTMTPKHQKIAKAVNRKAPHVPLVFSTSEDAFLFLVENHVDGIVLLNEAHVVIYANPAFCALVQKDQEGINNQALPMDLDLTPLIEGQVTRLTFKISTMNANFKTYEVTCQRCQWMGKASFIVRLHKTVEKIAPEVNAKGIVDPVTKLPTHDFFTKEVKWVLAKARGLRQTAALIYLDLDNFYLVNRMYGQSVGDSLLLEVARTLHSLLRPGDTIARIKSNEFAIILSGRIETEYPVLMARNILELLSKKHCIENHLIPVTASIGIALYPLDGVNVSDLMHYAEEAKIFAKESGKNQYQLFSQEIKLHNKRRRQLITGLSGIFQREELRVRYQPIIDVKTECCFGVEALVRWHHPVLGKVLPEQFLPLAEEAGLMADIGKWVLEKALTDYSAMQTKDMRISINISVNDLVHTRFIDHVVGWIQAKAVPINQVIFELTENAIMRDPVMTIEKLSYLSAMGIPIAVDDYGTAYSALSLLRQLPISYLKIDKSFVDEVPQDACSTFIVQSTIQLCHNLGLKVIAEGVENLEQCEFLKQCGCDYMQGYYYAKPLTLEELIIFLNRP